MLCLTLAANAIHEEDEPSHEIPECRDNPELECPVQTSFFSTLASSEFYFAIFAACQSLPDLIVPSYAAHRMYGLLWLSVFVFLNFVMLNVVLATVFSAYQDQFKARTIERFKHRAIGMYEAFDVAHAPFSRHNRPFPLAKTQL